MGNSNSQEQIVVPTNINANKAELAQVIQSLVKAHNEKSNYFTSTIEDSILVFLLIAVVIIAFILIYVHAKLKECRQKLEAMEATASKSLEMREWKRIHNRKEISE